MLPACSPLRFLKNALALRPFNHIMLVTLLAVTIVPCLGQAFAQEPASQTTLSDLQEQWKTINQTLDGVQQKLDSDEGDASELREKYADLVDQANATIEKILDAAMNQIETSKGKDTVATRAIMGILLNAAKAGEDAQVLKTGDFLIKHNVNPIWFETAAKSSRIPIDAREIFDELLIRQRETVADDLPRVKLTTSQGDIVVELFENEAPETVGNFISLVENDFYKNIDFHRVLEGFMAQTGCPQGTGMGGPGYTIECECDSPEARPHFTGSLSMAKTNQPDTGGSQFFLTFTRTDSLDGRHTVFGRVIDGLDILENLQRTHVPINGREEEIPDIKKDEILSAEVIRKRDHVYRPNKVGVDEPPLETPETVDEDPPVADDTATKDETANRESDAADQDADDQAEN
jgi:cyclophilin family peptidyl-prolyl cis-trans isomerase